MRNIAQLAHILLSVLGTICIIQFAIADTPVQQVAWAARAAALLAVASLIAVTMWTCKENEPR
jgi:hypothetical protein